MLNDNQKPVTNNQRPQTSSMPPVPTDDMSPIVVEETTPPMLNDDDLPVVNTPPTVAVEEKTNETDSGSAAPSDDVKLPPVVMGTTPKKKFAGGKVIATILGIFLLVEGVGTGVYLTGQNQNIEERAKSSDYAHKCDNVVCKSNEICVGDGVCRWVGNPGMEGDGSVTIPGDPKRDDRIKQYENIKDYNERCLYLTGPDCGGGAWCTQEFSSDCALWEPNPPADNPTTPPTTPTITASCQNVKAYDEAWTLLTSTQLSQLSVGDSVNFCVAGSATGGSFNKARFTINGVAQAETTTVRPGSTDFCQLYVIPVGVTTFNVSAQINHVTLGWK